MISWWWIPVTVLGCGLVGAYLLYQLLKDMFRW